MFLILVSKILLNFKMFDGHKVVDSNGVNQTSSSKVHIIVIDNQINRFVEFKKELEKESGYEVDLFDDPLEALDIFLKNPFIYYIMVINVRIPEISSFEIVRKVRGLNFEIKIIMITNFTLNKEEWNKVLPSTHIDEFVSRPIDIKKLLQIVKRMG